MSWISTFAFVVFIEGCAEAVRLNSMGTHPFYPHIIIGVISLTATYFRWRNWFSLAAKKRQQLVQEYSSNEVDKRGKKKTIVGFFHPYCNAGGGGEAVLWTAVAYLQRTEPDVICAIYSGDKDATKEGIIANVKSRFNIDLAPSSLTFVWLKNRSKVDAESWPRFTLLGQSAGSMILAVEALNELVPDIFIDTMGYAFTFPLIAVLSRFLYAIPVGAYVHYPTISTDMLDRVQSRTAGHTNASDVASSRWKSTAKLLYYQIFAFLYSSCLLQADAIVVNSSWTKQHIDSLITMVVSQLWRFSSAPKPQGVSIVYPPCNMDKMKQFPFKGRDRIVLSIAQFRPEKEHSKQIQVLDEFLKKNPSCRDGDAKVRLVLVGGCRSSEDEARVEELKTLVKELDLEANVKIMVNTPYDELRILLARSSVGISTMVDEHFGINVVEYMASGLIPLVHASGGPLNDIVTPYPSDAEEPQPTGYHETDVSSYADALTRIFVEASEDEIMAMRIRARSNALERFGKEEFEDGWAMFWEALKAERERGDKKER